MRGRMLVLAVILLAIVVGASIALGFRTTDARSVDSFTSMEELQEQEVMFFPEHRVYLVHNDGDPVALSDDAQHVGDTVDYCPSSRMFESSAHGEKFDILGRYYAGPARRGLARYGVSVEDDLIYVDLQVKAPGPLRNRPKAMEPEGPFCYPN